MPDDPVVDLPIAVPQAVALKGIPDVELVAVGSWKASTGPVTITDDDVNQAVSALDCPGIHNPVLKLGHDEPDPDGQHIRWDGEPAVGWVSNMRLSSNGAKVLGDYTGVPAWLVDVMPSAYPQRSVEIQRDFLCQIGHVHPFVITAVSLLGVFPPAVGVIKSLNDVQALYTLAADPGPQRGTAERRIAMAFALPGDDREQRRDLTDTEQQSTADFDRDHREWEAGVAALLAAWPSITRKQRDQLTAQIVGHVDAGQLAALANLDVDSTTAADTLYNEMSVSAREALDEQIAEARRQGVTDELNVEPDDKWIKRVAASIAATMAVSLAATAGRDAAQLAAPGATGQFVADSVATKLSDLSTRFLVDQFGGAIGAARMAGRYAVLSAAPSGEYYAAEVNDTNTCSNCRSVDGTKFDTLDEAMSAYGSGGYGLCSGGGRCRGRLITVWQVDTAFAADTTSPSFLTAVPTTFSLLSGGQPMPLPAKIMAKVSAEDISRAYYQTAGYSNWITALHVDPLELVTCDDTSGDYYRVPITVSGDTVEFGDRVQVQVEYVDVKTPSGGNKVKARSVVYADDSGQARLSAFTWSDRASALDLVGGEPPVTPSQADDGGTTPPIAADVTPAGAAIRKMAAATGATQTPPADTAGGPVSTTQEASGMPFDAAKLREALGLAETASADEALSAFAGALSSLGGGQTTNATDPAQAAAPAALSATPPAAPTGPVSVPQLADGNRPILLDPSQLASLQESARKGETAWAQLRRNERDGVIDNAIRLGKFPAARREYWVQLWDRDPDGTRQAVDALAANVIPVLSQGYLGDDAAQRSASDQAYEGLFGKEG